MVLSEFGFQCTYSKYFYGARMSIATAKRIWNFNLFYLGHSWFMRLNFPLTMQLENVGMK